MIAPHSGWAVAVSPAGHLEPVDSSAPIAADFVRPLDTAVDRCIAVFGADLVAVYLRGSVARGTAVIGSSDCDVVAIVDRPSKRRVDHGPLEEPLLIAGVRLDIARAAVSEIDIDGRRRDIGGMLSLEGRCVHGRAVATAPAILDRTIDPLGRLERIVHAIARQREHWPSGRFAWRLLRAGAQQNARRTRRYALDLVPTIEQLVSAGEPWTEPRLVDLDRAVRNDDPRGCPPWMFDLALEVLRRSEDANADETGDDDPT